MKKNKTHCDLNSCFLCRQCSKEWLPALHAHRETFHVAKGEALFKEGDTMTGLWFIQGKIQSTQTMG